MPIRLSSEQEQSLRDLAARIASFEAEPTRSGRTTGEAQGGRNFEHLVSVCLVEFVKIASSLNKFQIIRVKSSGINSSLLNKVKALKYQDKAILFCFGSSFMDLEINSHDFIHINDTVLKTKYSVSEWYDPIIPDAESKGWIPEEDESDVEYRGKSYKEIYSDSNTEFDGVMIFINKDIVDRKFLVECKSAKSSQGSKVDGNAHERFAYQNLDYLEISCLYPRTGLILMANEAFVKYRNKYHTGFCAHSLRLSSVFTNYSLDIICTRKQYYNFFIHILNWLVEP